MSLHDKDEYVVWGPGGKPDVVREEFEKAFIDRFTDPRGEKGVVTFRVVAMWGVLYGLELAAKEADNGTAFYEGETIRGVITNLKIRQLAKEFERK